MPDTDTATRADIEEALGHACREAKRKPRVIGKIKPSAWDELHGFIDALLDDLDALAAQGFNVPPNVDDSPAQVIR